MTEENYPYIYQDNGQTIHGNETQDKKKRGRKPKAQSQEDIMDDQEDMVDSEEIDLDVSEVLPRKKTIRVNLTMTRELGSDISRLCRKFGYHMPRTTWIMNLVHRELIKEFDEKGIDRLSNKL